MPERPTRYRLLADELAAALNEGRYPAGAQLPSLRQLCADHRASLATVTHALHELEDAGLIEARPRRGHFVRGVSRPPARPSRPSLALEGRRKRMVELATTQAGCVSLSHLSMAPALLPLAALQRQITKALADDPTVLASGVVFGTQALREQIARRLMRAGCTVDAEDIVVTHGEGDALELCLRHLTQPGDVIAVPEPASPRKLELVAHLGLKPLAIPAPQDGGFSVEALAFALQHHDLRCCIVEPTFDSVRGSSMPDAAREGLARLLQRHGVPLIERELMGELSRGPQRPRPVKAWDVDDQVLLCGSLACLTGPGFSVGWIVSRRHRLHLRAARVVHGELLPSLVDAALAGLLADRAFDAHLRRLRRQLATQTEAWVTFAQQVLPQGTRVSAGAGGHVIWVELPEGIDTAALLPGLREQGYSVIPGAAFGASSTLSRCLRLSAGHPLDRVRERGLVQLGEAVQAMVGRTQATPHAAAVRSLACRL